ITVNEDERVIDMFDENDKYGFEKSGDDAEREIGAESVSSDTEYGFTMRPAEEPKAEETNPESAEPSDEASNDEAPNEDAAESGWSSSIEADAPYAENAVSEVEPHKKAPKKKSPWRAVGITAVCAVVAGALFSGTLAIALPLMGVETVSTTSDIETTQAILNMGSSEKSAEDLTVEQIVESCLPSVVSITNKSVSEIMTFFGNYQQESVSSGSGIIIGKNDTELLIVTNYHVVADASELTVIFSHDENNEDETSYMKTPVVKGYDADKDIAVVSIPLSEIDDETMSKIAIATIGDSNELKMGSGVIAIGNALGYGQSATRGIVSALNREITTENANGVTVTNKYIQTDAAINGGNSGGALLNMAGEVVGINTAKTVSTSVEGIGYAIPISDVVDLIDELMNIEIRDVVDEEDRGYLGIQGDDVTTSDSSRFGMPVGAYIVNVYKNSPADDAGLQKGDIITKIDNVTISTLAELQDRLSRYSAGETVTLVVSRRTGGEYTETNIEVTLGTKSQAGIE
ncbi:MAG: trypsin-like peptidase domain-containing protein, partial [Clostridia bacterium]|nr:trypsin-like peptidase domain-containing protein [Clostridia bacterium]